MRILAMAFQLCRPCHGVSRPHKHTNTQTIKIWVKDSLEKAIISAVSSGFDWPQAVYSITKGQIFSRLRSWFGDGEMAEFHCCNFYECVFVLGDAGLELRRWTAAPPRSRTNTTGWSLDIDFAFGDYLNQDHCWTWGLKAIWLFLVLWPPSPDRGWHRLSLSETNWKLEGIRNFHL